MPYHCRGRKAHVKYETSITFVVVFKSVYVPNCDLRGSVEGPWGRCTHPHTEMLENYLGMC